MSANYEPPFTLAYEDGRLAEVGHIGIDMDRVRLYLLDLVQVKQSGRRLPVPEEGDRHMAAHFMRFLPEGGAEGHTDFRSYIFVMGLLDFQAGMYMDSLFTIDQMKRVAADCVRHFHDPDEKARVSLIALLAVTGTSDMLRGAVAECLAENPEVEAIVRQDVREAFTAATGRTAGWGQSGPAATSPSL